MQHIWIFQLATAPSAAAKSSILDELSSFVAVWKAHGAPVPGAVELRHDRFVIVQATPGHASGCSIDSMTKGVTDILRQHGLQVLGAERVLFRDADGSIADMDFKDARAHVASGRIHADTIVFDSTMGQSNDLNLWEVPMHKTWLGRFLPQRA